jgi:ABC-2 type transport system ATP-binding protein
LRGCSVSRRRARATRAATLLDRVGIGPRRRRQQLRKFSKGMIQRVGIAQALLNDPRVVSSTSRCRASIRSAAATCARSSCELRDQGRTSSSARTSSRRRALCSRVAVVRRRPAAASGTLADILAFQVRGWELVIAIYARTCCRMRRSSTSHRDLAAAIRARAAARPSPERLLSRTDRPRGGLVSLNPLRDTLEDFFVRRVAEIGTARGAARRTEPDARD